MKYREIMKQGDHETPLYILKLGLGLKAQRGRKF